MKEQEQELKPPVRELDYYKFTEEGMKDLILALDTIGNPHSKRAVINALNNNMMPVMKEI